MKDTIYRQDALMALSKEVCGDKIWALDARDAIVHLPSAESEIIYCKDCKHMIINEKHEAKPMICCFTKMCGTTEPDWFCADGERRDNE